MEPPREGRALSTWGFLSFQLLGPPSLVDSRGSGQTRPCKVGGVRWVGEPLPRPGGGGRTEAEGRWAPHPGPCPSRDSESRPRVILSGDLHCLGRPGRAGSIGRGPPSRRREGTAVETSGTGWGAPQPPLPGSQQGSPALPAPPTWAGDQTESLWPQLSIAEKQASSRDTCCPSPSGSRSLERGGRTG